MLRCIYYYSVAFLLMILLICYAYNDVITSGQAGNLERMNRTNVYLLLISITFVLSCVYFFSKVSLVKINKISLLLWCIFFWQLFVDLILGGDVSNMLTRSFLCYLWIVSYAFPLSYLQEKEENISFLNVFVLMFFVYVAINIFARINIQILSDNNFAVTGYIYYIIILVPALFMISAKFFRVICIAIALLMILTSFKRGAIIILPIMCSIYIYSSYKLQNKKTLNLLFVLMFLFLFLFLLFTVVDTFTDNVLSSRFSKEEIADGSGRYDIYSYILSELSHRRFEEWFFGTGGDSVLKTLGISAHNDWLEFIFCYGIIGGLLYLSLIISLFGRFLQLLRMRSRYASYWGMIFIYVLLISFFGAFYFSHSTLYVFLFLGYLEKKSLLEY